MGWATLNELETNITVTSEEAARNSSIGSGSICKGGVMTWKLGEMWEASQLKTSYSGSKSRFKIHETYSKTFS